MAKRPVLGDETDPLDPADLNAFEDGALTTPKAVEWSSIPRCELFNLMNAGVLRWFRDGNSRRISRKDLREELARRYAEHKRNPPPPRKVG
ncbi:MAG: hypothetical protein J0I06_07825 [Planctomycetes bacterium]|nr:hypothetical protein [Planctomycetota bacterium]